MNSVTGSFRGKLFGGFDRNDVSAYIEKLAADRNRYKGEAEKLGDKAEELESRINLLEERISALSESLDAAETEARAAKEREEEYKHSAFSRAEAALGELKKKYEVLREEIVTAAVRLRTEMCDAGEKITGLAAQLETAEEAFSPLRLALSEDPKPEQDVDMLAESDGEDTFRDAFAESREETDILPESDGEDIPGDLNVTDEVSPDSPRAGKVEELFDDRYIRLQAVEDLRRELDGEDYGINFRDISRPYPEIKWEP